MLPSFQTVFYGIIAAKRLLYFYFYAGFLAPLGQPKTMAVYTVPALPAWYNKKQRKRCAMAQRAAGQSLRVLAK